MHVCKTYCFSELLSKNHFSSDKQVARNSKEMEKCHSIADGTEV